MGEQHVSTDDSVLLMSPRVIYGRPDPRLKSIRRGEVQGTLTEYSSAAWQIGKVVGYAPHGEASQNLQCEEFLH